MFAGGGEGRGEGEIFINPPSPEKKHVNVLYLGV